MIYIIMRLMWGSNPRPQDNRRNDLKVLRSTTELTRPMLIVTKFVKLNYTQSKWRYKFYYFFLIFYLLFSFGACLWLLFLRFGFGGWVVGFWPCTLMPMHLGAKKLVENSQNHLIVVFYCTLFVQPVYTFSFRKWHTHCCIICCSH